MTQVKIVGFVVRVECDHCKGKKVAVRWPFREGKKPERCLPCKGLGHVEGTVAWEKFEALMHGAVDAAVTEAVQRIRRHL